MALRFFPSSIFFRIYGGLLFVITMVALCVYFLFGQINEHRSAQYRQQMATGFFRLIALGVSRQPEGPLRDAWLQEASSLVEAPLQQVTVQAGGFTESELEELATGQAVVHLNLSANYADIYARIPQQKEAYVKARMSKVSEQQAKALAIFLLDELQHYPGREAQRLRELQPFFQFQISLQPHESVGLDTDQRARIKRNEVVLALKEGAGTSGSSVRIIAPSMYPTQLLVIGPMYLFDWRPVELLIGISAVSLLVITLAAYLIVHPLERRIRNVEQAVRLIRAGDLSARAYVHGRDEVSQLATAFNSMAEHIQRLIDSQRELTRAVSHELRTPVARIRFAMEMMADTDDADARFEQLAQLDHDVDELNKLIDEILTYAKLEQGTPILKFESVDLGELLQRVGKETEALGIKARVSLKLPPTGSVAEAEARYLHRVLQNLAGNAVRYANAEIRLSAGIHEHTAWVCVEDDGPGIPEKDRERVFQPFTRLDDSRTRSSGGYGLGLSIVARIAFWFGGNIRVEASPELGGARFIMCWPVVQTRRNKNGRHH